MKWTLQVLALVFASQAFGQMAPTGDHYAGRASDTGFGAALVNASGNYTVSIPLNLPAARGDIPLPLQVVYGGRSVGAAGLGWDIPLSYVQRDRTFARRRPLSSAGFIPTPRERVYLSLLGQTIELVRKGTSNTWLARSGSLMLTVREAGGKWYAYDGSGRTYIFERSTLLSATGFWFLSTVRAPGNAEVRLTYQVASGSVNGGAAISINLTRLSYNFHPTEGCAKNEISLTYGYGSSAPLSLSVMGDRILVRRRLLTTLNVGSRATCASPLRSLRQYQFFYPAENLVADTGLPRLRAVRMFGREGSAEASISLPVMSFDYGSATKLGALQYQDAPSISLPSGIAGGEVAETLLNSSVDVAGGGHQYEMWQSLIDVTGDGRPDLVFKKNDKLWVAYNQPAPGGITTIGAGPAIGQLSDTTFSDGPFSTHTSTQVRFLFDTAKRNTVDVWRRAIDVNGDGRLDIIDAGIEPDHWVVFLNTPGSLGNVRWQRRSYSIRRLRETLTNYGHLIKDNLVPLSRRATGTNLKLWECYKGDGTNWAWYPQGFQNGRCDGVDGGVDGASVDRGSERTFVEWDVTDINGDGYPDVVFDSSPVTFQLNSPDKTTFKPVVDKVFPRDFGIGGKLAVFFEPRATNEIRALFNVLGVRFYTDDDPFSRSVNLFAPGAAQGISEWLCTGSLPHSTEPCDDSKQSEFAALADVNGDGLVDRVVGFNAFLGMFPGTAMSFAQVHLTLPGPLASETNTRKQVCVSGNISEPESDQTQGLRDITGDGIPDYFTKADPHLGSRIRIGTGIGFSPAPGIPLTGSFSFSHEQESCDGVSSRTDRGLFDIDDDGQPEVVRVNGASLAISRLTNDDPSGSAAAGRLTTIDNGYGAVTRISYASAKVFTDSPVPFPEIVVSAVATTGTRNLGGSLAGSRFAYGNASQVFDSGADGFTFPGYMRTVEIALTGETPDRDAGAATVTDRWPLAAFSLGLSKDARWLREQLTGRVRDIIRFRGTAESDPWTFLDISASDPSLMGIAHFEWNAKRFEEAAAPGDGIVNCLEIVEPLDFQKTLAAANNNGVDMCRTHGFAFGASSDIWYGGAAPPSDNNIELRASVLGVDDFGRVRATKYENDVSRNDDDICTADQFSTPTGTGPEVLGAISTHRIYDCNKEVTLVSESWEYDGLSAGSVSQGRMTSHILERRKVGDGTLLGTVRAFDATYDATGNLITVRSQRDAAQRTSRFKYDEFGVTLIESRIDATAVPALVSSAQYDPFSLELLQSTDANQVQFGTEYDGFDRPIRSTMTPPAGQTAVLSTATYEGFADDDALGRRVVIQDTSGAIARRSTNYFDELGRKRFTELSLGSDYGNAALVVGARKFDGAGRLSFEADSYPKSQDANTAYGTNYYYKNTGELDCVVRARGRQPLAVVTDVAEEQFPTCYRRVFADHQIIVESRDADSLQSGSPQAGVVRRMRATAASRVLEQETWQGSTRIEDARFTYDALGRTKSMVRYLDASTPSKGVQSSWEFDSLGALVQLADPDSPTRYFTDSDWGEALDTHWTESGTDKRIIHRYDALGRLTSTEERTAGVVDPESVMSFSYDQGVIASTLVTPSYVLGRLARASAPSGATSFSYDAFGRTNADVFTDTQGGVYVERSEQMNDGSIASLEFNLPDRSFAKELVKYGYDSAGRLRTMNYADADGSRALFTAESIDAFGRLRKARYGEHTVYSAQYADVGRRLIEEVVLETPSGSRRIDFDRFDPVGRELMRREFKDDASTATKTNTSYDALGRLAIAVRSIGPQPLSSWSFDYDALGNILTLNDALGGQDAKLSYQTNDRDRLCRLGYGDNVTGADCNVLHDALGAITRMPTRDGSRELSYDLAGDARTIHGSGAQVKFAYDALGRVQEIDTYASPGTGHYLEHHYGSLIERMDATTAAGNTSLTTRRVPGAYGFLASRHGAKGDWIFQLGELRGSRYFTNQDGAFVQEVDYQPFGEARSTDNNPGDANYSSHQWNGGETLAALGIAQLGARLYDPVIGRFTRRDPLLNPGSSAAGNPYAFSVNDPLNAADPSGLDCIEGRACPPLVPVSPPSVDQLVSLFSGGASHTAAPGVSSGPLTPEGVSRFAMSMLINGFSPQGFNFDAAARTGESSSSTVERAGAVDSPERRASIKAYNATYDSMLGFSAGMGDALTFWCPGCASLYRAGAGIQVEDQYAYGVGSITGIVVTFGVGEFGAASSSGGNATASSGISATESSGVNTLAAEASSGTIRPMTMQELGTIRGSGPGPYRIVIEPHAQMPETQFAIESAATENSAGLERFNQSMAILKGNPYVGTNTMWNRPSGTWRWGGNFGVVTYDINEAEKLIILRTIYIR